MKTEINFVLRVKNQYLILTSYEYEKWLIYGTLPK